MPPAAADAGLARGCRRTGTDEQAQRQDEGDASRPETAKVDADHDEPSEACSVAVTRALAGTSVAGGASWPARRRRQCASSFGSLHARPKNEMPTGRPGHEAHRHRDVGIAGDRGRAGARAAVEPSPSTWSVSHAGPIVGATMASSRCRSISASMPSARVERAGWSPPPCGTRARRASLVASEITRRSWPKNGISRSRFALVEGDELGQALHRRGRPQALEVLVDVRLELVVEDGGGQLLEHVGVLSAGWPGR